MPIRPWPRSFPLSGRTVAVLCLGYLLFGLVGHDPWKTDDVINLDLALGLHDGDWLIPHLAGEPWLGTAPLYHWIAATLGGMLKAVLPWHDAARLASALFAGLGLYSLSIAARGFHGREAGLMAPLLATGTLGFLLPSHEAQPALVGFCATAMALAALGNWQGRGVAAGIALGTSLGIGFLGGGPGILIFLATVVLAAVAHPHWRNAGKQGWIAAALTAIPLTLFWPIALSLHPGQPLDAWWAAMYLPLMDAPAIDARRLEILAWASWPVLPLGLWTIWLHRHRLLTGQSFLQPVTVLSGFVFFFRSPNLTEGLLPLIAALTLLATAGTDRLRRGAANALDWFGGMTLSLFIGLIWLGGIAILTGLPARVAKNFTKPAPGFIPDWSWPALIVAGLVTLAWLRMLAGAPRSPWRAATRWSIGVGAISILLATLWLPWIEYGKTYRGVSADFRRVLGDNPGCVERQGLGAAQRASLDYFEGIRTAPATATRQCEYWLVQTVPRAAGEIDGWNLVLDTARPGDRNERLRLYRRKE